MSATSATSAGADAGGQLQAAFGVTLSDPGGGEHVGRGGDRFRSTQVAETLTNDDLKFDDLILLWATREEPRTVELNLNLS